MIRRTLVKWILKILPHKHREVVTPEEFIVNLQQSPDDERDKAFAVLPSINLPPEFDFSELFPPVKNQGRIGSCGSHATATAVEVACARDAVSWDDVPLSERFHYYVVRSPQYENTLPRDSGQKLRDAMKVANKVGLCPEQLCPYDEMKFNEKPGIMAYGFAGLWKISMYQFCYDIASVKTALIQLQPVVFGIKVHKDIFLTDFTGDLKGQGIVVGGHALCACGYNDEHENPDGTKGAIFFQNSWGKDWGRGGYGWISYSLFMSSYMEAWAVVAK